MTEATGIIPNNAFWHIGDNFQPHNLSQIRHFWLLGIIHPRDQGREMSLFNISRP
jgi:hypothetical protein